MSIVAFGLFYPIDALLTQVFHSKARKIQIATQSFISLLFLIGISLGFSISTQFIRSRKISSPHQVLGIIILILCLSQIPLGIFLRRAQGPQNHPQNNEAIPPIPSQTKTKVYIKRVILTHRLLAFLVFVIGLMNIGLGFDFALASKYNKLWVPLTLALVVLWGLGVGFRYMYVSNWKDGREEEDCEGRMRKAYAELSAGENGRQEWNSLGHAQYEMSDFGKDGARVGVEQYKVPVYRS